MGGNFPCHRVSHLTNDFSILNGDSETTGKECVCKQPRLINSMRKYAHLLNKSGTGYWHMVYPNKLQMDKDNQASKY